jgi:hypothetical protein
MSTSISIGTSKIVPSLVSTSDNLLTPVTVVPILLNTSKNITFEVKARNPVTGFSLGAKCFCVATNISGVVSQVSTLELLQKSTLPNSVKPSTSVLGTNIVLNVKGVNGQPINWEIYITQIL